MFLAAAVDDGASVGPGAEGMVAIAVGKRIVDAGQAVLAVVGHAAIDEDVLVLDLAHRRSLEEAERMVLLAAGYHVLDNLCAGLHRGHRRGVELGAVRLLEAPVAIGASVGVGEDAWVEVKDAFGAGGVILAPVAHLERPVGAVRLRHHRLAAACLVVRIEVVGLPSILVHHLVDIGGKQHVALAIGAKQLAVGVLLRFEDHPVVAPVAQVIDRSRPHDLIQAAVHGHQVVVRPVDIDAVLSRIVGIFKYVRFAVGDELPQRQVRVLCNGCRSQQGQQAHGE